MRGIQMLKSYHPLFIAFFLTAFFFSSFSYIQPLASETQNSIPESGKQFKIDSTYGQIIKSAIKDRTGALWFATSWLGVFRYDGKTFTNYTEKDGLSSNEVNAVYEDSKGMLWFATNNWLCQYDGKTFKKVPNPTSEATSAYPVMTISEDKAGNLWFGMWCAPGRSGAYKYDGKSFTQFFPEALIQGVIEDKEGGIWFNQKRYDGRTAPTSESSITDFSDSAGAFISPVFCSFKDRQGNVWFGVRSDGLYRFDGKGFTSFSSTDGLFANRVTCIYQDSRGLLWVGSDIKDGTKIGELCCYDGKTFTLIKAGMNSFWTAVEDNSGNLYFGGREGKLCKYDGKTFNDLSAQLIMAQK
jgi:hypothetical protein